MAKTIWVSAAASSGGSGGESSPFQTIGQALAVAQPGTTIMVKPGTYVENVAFKVSGTADAPITLVSAGGPGAAVIKPASQSYDTVAVGGHDHLKIDGFTIHAPTTTMNGIAVYARQSGSSFDPASDVTIQNNTIIGGAGDGIKGSKAEHLTILNNTITGLTGKESGIDFVGVNHAVISGNTVSDIADIGIMLKGGSSDIRVEHNLVDGTGSSGIEVGGYTELPYYWPGFLDRSAYEIKDVVVAGNEIRDTGGTGLRLIGAQQVQITGNEIHQADNYIVSIDDSSKFHSTWKSSDISFSGNSFEAGSWLKNRSAGSGITQGSNFTDGRDLGAGATPSKVTQPTAPVDTAPSPDHPAPTPDRPAPTPDLPAPVPDRPTVPAADADKAGGSGSDRLEGSGQDDHLAGNGGDDTLSGKAGADLLDGGDGKDRLEGDDGDDRLLGGAGDDQLNGGSGRDTLAGGAGDDRIKGDDGNDLLGGDDGNDRLSGDAGDDQLDGGAGNDTLEGGDGRDLIWGGPGADTLKGGQGADTFVFRELGDGVDTITDFSRTEDHISFDLNGVDDFSDLSFRSGSDGSTIIYLDQAGTDVDLVRVDHVSPSLLTSDHFYFL